MSAAAILYYKRCWLCKRKISLSIAKALGDDEHGFICLECLDDERRHKKQLLRELEADIVLESPDPSPPCVTCGTRAGNDRYEVFIDGRKGYLCPPHADAFFLKNRDRLRGLKVEYDLKLR